MPKRGDVREDGLVFWGCRSDMGGKEIWVSVDTFEQKKAQLRKSWKKYSLTEKYRQSVLRKEAQPKRIESKKAYIRSDRWKARAKILRQREHAKEKARLNAIKYQKSRLPYHRKWKSQRRNNDPIYRLKENCRSRLYSALIGKGWSKKGSASDHLGCSYQELMAHLESQFLPGMTWGNRGLWEIDHIVPLSSASTPDELFRLCKYTNLQPLWKSCNRRKSSKMPVFVKDA